MAGCRTWNLRLSRLLLGPAMSFFGMSTDTAFPVALRRCQTCNRSGVVRATEPQLCTLAAAETAPRYSLCNLHPVQGVPH